LKATKILTLCVVHNNSHVLLGLKKRGFGEGRWNGFGGKVQGDESIKEAALRELEEEAGIKLLDIKKRGVLTFDLPTEENLLEVHIFSGSNFEGEPEETEEMAPKWFSHHEVPFNQMWPDDEYWLPLLLKGKNFCGTIYPPSLRCPSELRKDFAPDLPAGRQTKPGDEDTPIERRGELHFADQNTIIKHDIKEV